MGDRGQVHVLDTGVYLYTYSRAMELPTLVANALALEERWDDPECLGRIILDAMTEGADATTGFGISSQRTTDVWCTVIVDVHGRTVTLQEEMIDGHETEQRFTFEELIEGFATDD